ncbi:MAG: hypothetical protein SGARI_006463 [Bacillariaceae sp.]
MAPALEDLLQSASLIPRLIDGFVEGDEANVTPNSVVTTTGRTGASIHDTKAGRGGADRGRRGGDDDDGGSGSSSSEEEEEEDAGTDPDCEDDSENPDSVPPPPPPENPGSGGGDGTEDDGPKTYIITYKEDMNNQATIDTANTVEFAVESTGGQIEQVYTEVLNGMAATLTKDAAMQLMNEPGVEAVVEDTINYIDAIPWGTDRIDQWTGRNSNYRYQWNKNAGSGVNVCVSEKP